MKIILNPGHTLPNQPGAGAVSGKFIESNMTRQVTKELSRLLKAKGHSVVECVVDKATSQNEYLKKVVQLANSKDGDLFISIHFNSSTSTQANGCEVYTWNGKKHIEAIKTCYELSLLNFKNRGIKKGDHLYVVRNTKAKALLIEVCFISNPDDRTTYNKVGYAAIAKAIADAIN